MGVYATSVQHIGLEYPFPNKFSIYQFFYKCFVIFWLFQISFEVSDDLFFAFNFFSSRDIGRDVDKFFFIRQKSQRLNIFQRMRNSQLAIARSKGSQFRVFLGEKLQAYLLHPLLTLPYSTSFPHLGTPLYLRSMDFWGKRVQIFFNVYLKPACD